MNELIKIEKTEGKETVNARELHEFLESKQDFSNWVNKRIKKYGFIEGKDFTINLLKSSGGRPEKEYHISIEMGKELSMVENNDKGRQARLYFIDCEKKLQTLPETMNLKMLSILDKITDRLEKLENNQTNIMIIQRLDKLERNQYLSNVEPDNEKAKRLGIYVGNKIIERQERKAEIDKNIPKLPFH